MLKNPIGCGKIEETYHESTICVEAKIRCNMDFIL